MHTLLWDSSLAFDGFSPYLLGDSRYPVLPWLVVPHRGRGNLSVAEGLFNKRLSRGRVVIENAFGILKQTFRELLVKSELEVSFMPDVILCCAILHNVLFGQAHEDVDHLLQMLRMEGLAGEVVEDDIGMPEELEAVRNDDAMAEGVAKRRNLGLFLTLERNVP